MNNRNESLPCLEFLLFDPSFHSMQILQHQKSPVVCDDGNDGKNYLPAALSLVLTSFQILLSGRVHSDEKGILLTYPGRTIRHLFRQTMHGRLPNAHVHFCTTHETILLFDQSDIFEN